MAVLCHWDSTWIKKKKSLHAISLKFQINIRIMVLLKIVKVKGPMKASIYCASVMRCRLMQGPTLSKMNKWIGHGCSWIGPARISTRAGPEYKFLAHLIYGSGSNLVVESPKPGPNERHCLSKIFFFLVEESSWTNIISHTNTRPNQVSYK